MYHRFIKQIFDSLVHNFSKMAEIKGINGYKYSTSKILDLEANRIIWIDMEMTGLNVDDDKIMEIACLVTDSDLNIIAESEDIIIQQPKEILDKMDEWCQNQHGKTGLTQACLNSNKSLEDAENSILDFLKKHVTYKLSPLAGNSVYMDRYFLMKHMPKVNDYLHYRIIDVSTIKEICRRWNPNLYKTAPEKEYDHRALQDIRESVKELQFYKNNFLHVLVKDELTKSKIIA